MEKLARIQKKLLTALPWIALAIAVTFNLVILKAEATVKSDPNDNIFQFALVNRTNIIWETYGCPIHLVSCGFRLFDHWTPEWGEGYPLPFYYSHLPQIVIVASYHLFITPLSALLSQSVSLFTYYHWLVYLAICLFPISVLMALRVIGLSPLTQAFGTLLASHISTDGLYGLDNSSYLWRGYGLSSQLFASLFLPLAFAYTYRVLVGGSKAYLPAVFFLVLTLSCHFGIGYIAILSCLPLLFTSFEWKSLVGRLKDFTIIVGTSIAVLAYWIIPFLGESNFNAISFWDPVWKFNSFGAIPVLIKFFSGDLADFGRLPVLTILTLVAFFVIVLSKHHRIESGQTTLLPLALLLPFWLVLYFGRTTLGGLMDFLPGTGGFHLHRFIIGFHLTLLFLAPVAAAWLGELISQNLAKIASLYSKNEQTKLLITSTVPFIGSSVCLVVLVILLYPQTAAYAKPNSAWIANSNHSYNQDWPDFARMMGTITTVSPGRIYAGKAGYWGKDQNVGSSKVYMAVSTSGKAVGQFMPETWSPNSDTEQFFDDRLPEHYDLYNFRYTVSPESVTMPSFLKKIASFGKYHLYEAQSSGYFTIGKSNLGVLANRTNYQNLVHLWLQSPLVGQKIFPVLVFSHDDLPTAINSVTMIDPTTYAWNTGQAGEISIFSQSPLGKPSNYATPQAAFADEKVRADQEYSATVTVAPDCTDCFVVFKSTFHPNWKAFIDGKPSATTIVFPFFVGIPIAPGTHRLEVRYVPNQGKMLLLGLSLILLLSFVFLKIKRLYSMSGVKKG